MSTSSSKLIILDRDGVINEDRDDYVKSADEWVPLPGSLEAIALLNQAGYQIAIATNQSSIGDEVCKQEDVELFNKYLYLKILEETNINISVIVTCPHSKHLNCNCRKPEPGLVLKATHDYDIDLQNSIIIGDTWRELELGEKLGIKTFLVSRVQSDTRHPVVGSLGAARKFLASKFHS